MCVREWVGREIWQEDSEEKESSRRMGMIQVRHNNESGGTTTYSAKEQNNSCIPFFFWPMLGWTYSNRMGELLRKYQYAKSVKE